MTYILVLSRSPSHYGTFWIIISMTWLFKGFEIILCFLLFNILIDEGMLLFRANLVFSASFHNMYVHNVYEEIQTNGQIPVPREQQTQYTNAYVRGPAFNFWRWRGILLISNKHLLFQSQQIEALEEGLKYAYN